MHPKICNFASEWFYKGRLKTGIDKNERIMIKGIKWPNIECPVLFVKYNGFEESKLSSNRASMSKIVVTEQQEMSFYNRHEIDITLRLLYHTIKSSFQKNKNFKYFKK